MDCAEHVTLCQFRIRDEDDTLKFDHIARLVSPSWSVVTTSRNSFSRLQDLQPRREIGHMIFARLNRYFQIIGKDASEGRAHQPCCKHIREGNRQVCLAIFDVRNFQLQKFRWKLIPENTGTAILHGNGAEDAVYAGQ